MTAPQPTEGEQLAATAERLLVVDYIDAKIRACEQLAHRATGEDARGFEITFHRLTALREEIAAGLHVPAQPFGEP